MNKNITKALRFISIYGIKRTLYKIFGRMRSCPKILTNKNPKTKHTTNVGFIGCGQFSFATISYFVNQSSKYHIKAVYDIDSEASNSFSFFNNVPVVANTIDSFFLEDLDYIFIASNHFSHSEYAIKALEQGISVHIEKPICVNWEQFEKLGKAISLSTVDIFVGYNRPLSPAVIELKSKMKNIEGPLTLNCFVTGHLIDLEHWYRLSREGTRVCGNLGHWIDLSIHLLSDGGLPEFIDVTVVPSSNETKDDNLSVTMTTINNDLITLILTSRCEPFEGINETINFAKGTLLAKIDDFRQATFWEDSNIDKRNYFPKDVGHKNAILQGLNTEVYRRDLDEIRISTALMLEVKDMLLKSIGCKRFYINDNRYKW